jgi:hypothetical protein
MAGNEVRVTDDSGNGPGVVQVRSADRVLQFAGALIASASTSVTHAKPRWTEMALYRVDDGTGRYVIQRVGRSRVYHRLGGPCGAGTAAPISELSDDSVPCDRCSPPVLDVIRTMPWAKAALEQDRFVAVTCDDAAAVLAQLRRAPEYPDHARPSLTDSRFSTPAQRLLDEARLGDPGIRAAALTVERL